MQELIDTLCDEQHTLVVLHEGRIRTFDGQGVRHLYNMINEEPELLYDAKVAVKAVGRSAAAMMVEGGVIEVYAEYISQQAYDTLKEAGIKVSFEKKLNHQDFLNVWRKLGELEAIPAWTKKHHRSFWCAHRADL